VFSRLHSMTRETLFQTFEREGPQFVGSIYSRQMCLATPTLKETPRPLIGFLSGQFLGSRTTCILSPMFGSAVLQLLRIQCW
jgi:hypothetical protein